jgi:phosphatidylinositol alpha-1,6-mannosyltransferase
MRNGYKAQLFLAAESVLPGNGGISRLARLMGKVLAEERLAGRLDCRGVALSDTAPVPDLAVPLRACSGRRWQYAAEVWKASLAATHFAYDCLGMARAHCRLPVIRKPFLTWMCGIDVWEPAPAHRIAWAHRADLLLSISAYTRERADRIYGGLGHARVCWLGTESDDPPPSRPDFAGQPTVLIVGRLDPEPWKGHHALIDAWPRVTEAVPRARLVIVGTGPGLAAARARAGRSPAAGQIEFRGFVADDRIEAVWASATLYAMPGLMEGFGLVYAEAMRHGIPVIASVHDAGPEVNLEGVTGFNVNLQRSEELAERIIYLLREPDRAAEMGENGRRRWADFFRYSAFRDRFRGLLRSWIGGD